MEIPIYIPRLVIHEIEARASNEGSRERREALSAFNEIQRVRLLTSKVDLLPRQLDLDLLTRFSQIRGRRQVDSLIRREIRDAMYKGAATPWQERMVLLTRDMIMAYAASVEDIDSFYLSPAAPDSTQIIVSNFEHLARVIHETAVTLGEIMVDGLYDEPLTLEGMWSGKTLIDWNRERLKMKLHASDDSLRG